MPNTGSSNSEQDRPAAWACLEAHLPASSALRIGVLLLDTCSDSLHLEMRPNWWLGLVDREEYEIWEELSEDLRNKARTIGGKAFFRWLEESCSHVIQISSVQLVRVKQIETTLADIYRGQLPTLHAEESLQIACKEISAIHREGKAYLNPLRSFKKDRGWRTSSSLHGAIAATFLVGAFLTALHERGPVKTENYNQALSTELRLPLPNRHHYERVVVNLLAVSEKTSGQRKPRNTHQRRSVVHPFVIHLRSDPHRSTQIAALDPPRCCDGSDEANDALPLFLQSEPELPEYHPRHSRFVRILARVSTPFRYIASR